MKQLLAILLLSVLLLTSCKAPVSLVDGTSAITTANSELTMPKEEETTSALKEEITSLQESEDDTESLPPDEGMDPDDPTGIRASEFYIGMPYKDVYEVFKKHEMDPVALGGHIFFTETLDNAIILCYDKEYSRIRKILSFRMPFKPPSLEEYEKMESGTPIYEVVEKYGTPIGIFGSGMIRMEFQYTDENNEIKTFSVIPNVYEGETVMRIDRFRYIEDAIHPSQRLSAADMQIGMSKGDFYRVASKTPYMSVAPYIYGLAYEKNYTEYGNYIFFIDPENNSVVLHFGDDFILDRMEKYAPVAASSVATEVLQSGMSIYEVVEKVGFPWVLPNILDNKTLYVDGAYVTFCWEGAAMEDMKVESFADRYAG